MDHPLLVVLTTFLAATVRMAVPLALAGMGEAISEKSGVMNIGLEAVMLSGAFCSFMATFHTGSLWIGCVCAMVGGVAVSSLHALISLRYKANQTITGLALNFFVLGLTSFLFLKGFGKSTVLPSIGVVSPFSIPLLSTIPVIGQAVFSQDPFVYVAVLVAVLLAVVLYRTQWGVALIAVGEHPRAADTAGLDVEKIRWIASLCNGMLGGLGGGYLTLVKLGFFQENITAGKGYIALVAVILGRRHPFGVCAAALVVGAAEALQIRLQTLGVPIPSQVFAMFPYVVTVLVLLLSVGRSSDPAALGEPYERSGR